MRSWCTTATSARGATIPSRASWPAANASCAGRADTSRCRSSSTRDGPKVLAVGAELKGAVCLTKGRNAFLGQHLGDLKNAQALDFFEETVAHLCRILEIEPEIVAHDLHPDYFSTRYAKRLEARPPIRKPRAALSNGRTGRSSASSITTRTSPPSWPNMARKGRCSASRSTAPATARTGRSGAASSLSRTCGIFGASDIWRRCRFPAATRPIAEPWRTAVAYLHAAFGPEWANLDIPFVKRMDMGRARVVVQMIERRVNTPFTTSTGRLFDAVASLLGICDRNTHEGQAPMELEAAAEESVTRALPSEIRRENGVFLLDPRSYIRSAVERLRENVPAEAISAEFHNGLCNGVVAMCERIREAENISCVALSGGVFQNKLLFERTVRDLERKDFRVLTHQLVPPNDGCIALGQAAVAHARANG